MTFKHTKFDSPTLRALEKVAVEKGLVKPEPLEKKAAVTKKADYKPTANLMENIFKLCTGLRDSGLKKEADEIEMNYLNLKRAQTLYETSKETGDDLIHDAHPKGSHKLEGVDGDEATVEDILDQHIKIVEKVNKKPTGKLSEASSKDILNSVKKALGQAPPAPKQETADATPEFIAKLPAGTIDNWVKNQLLEAAWQAYGAASRAMGPLVTKLRNNEIEEYITTGVGEKLQQVNNAQASMRNAKSPSVEGFQAMTEGLKDVQNFAENQTSLAGWKDETLRSAFISSIVSALGKVESLTQVMKEFNRNPGKIPVNWADAGLPKPQMAKPAAGLNVTAKIDAILGNISYYNTLIDRRVPPQYRQAQKNYLKENADDLTIYKNRVLELQKTPELWDAQKDAFAKKVNEVDGWIKTWAQQWLKEQG